MPQTGRITTHLIVMQPLDGSHRRWCLVRSVRLMFRGSIDTGSNATTRLWRATWLVRPQWPTGHLLSNQELENGAKWTISVAEAPLRFGEPTVRTGPNRLCMKQNISVREQVNRVKELRFSRR
jgi:hypothetical protein